MLLLVALLPDQLPPLAVQLVALFALQFALGELWQSWGIEPDAVLGAGVGEYSAAVISGVLSCEDALKLIAERARILRLAPEGVELNRMLDAFELASCHEQTGGDVEVQPRSGEEAQWLDQPIRR